MRWPWRRGADDEDKALQEAQERLAEVRDQWPAVRQAAETMRDHKRRNHFAATIATIYRSDP